MAMDLPRPKRGFDRLPFVQILRPHFGENDAEKVADALGDEVSQLVSYPEVQAMMDDMKNFIRAEVNAALLKGVGLSAMIAGIALVIARLT